MKCAYTLMIMMKTQYYAYLLEGNCPGTWKELENFTHKNPGYYVKNSWDPEPYNSIVRDLKELEDDVAWDVRSMLYE